MKFFIVLVLSVATVNSSGLDAILKTAFSSGRVINGQDATKGEAPYIVSLQATGLLTGHICAGSLISPNLILTAAHCLIFKSFKVVAGLHTLNATSDVQVRKITSAQQYRQHELFTGVVGPNDIGLIYVPEAFVFNTLKYNVAAVAPISLPSGKYAQIGKGKLFGWGRDENENSPQVLQALDVDIIGYSQCKAELPFNAPLDESSNICTHTSKKTDGACNGDSGGPLIINTANGAELVGIVSWLYAPCHKYTYPSVYTMVSGFQDWIEKTAKDLIKT